MVFFFPFSFRCLSNVPMHMSGIWNKVAVLEGRSLHGLVPDLLDLQMGFRASSTVTKCKSEWLRWLSYSYVKPSVGLAERTNNCLTSDMGVSSVEAVVYGIKWAHSMAELVSCPVSHPLVKSALEGAKGKLAPPVRPEEPLSVGIVEAIVNFYSLDVSLAVPNFLFIL